MAKKYRPDLWKGYREWSDAKVGHALLDCNKWYIYTKTKLSGFPVNKNLQVGDNQRLVLFGWKKITEEEFILKCLTHGYQPWSNNNGN